MTKATVAEAKVRLGELIDAALRGERVVIMRGSRPTAVIVPANEKAPPDLHISDAAADFLANEARAELQTGVAQVHESPAAFVAAIVKPRRRA